MAHVCKNGCRECTGCTDCIPDVQEDQEIEIMSFENMGEELCEYCINHNVCNRESESPWCLDAYENYVSVKRGSNMI